PTDHVGGGGHAHNPQHLGPVGRRRVGNGDVREVHRAGRSVHEPTARESRWLVDSTIGSCQYWRAASSSASASLAAATHSPPSSPPSCHHCHSIRSSASPV